MTSTARGRTTKRWRKIAAQQRAKGLPCFHCGQPIDYALQWPDPNSYSADHLLPVATHPELAEDPGNVVSSHLRCNQAKGASAHFSPGLGGLSESF